MISVKINEIMPQDYVDLSLRCDGRSLGMKEAIGALKESQLLVGLYDEGELEAFGRVCGDGHLLFVVCDILVDPRYTDKKLELAIVKKIEDYLKLVMNRDATVLVRTERPLDELFLRLGYQYFDEDYEMVMKKTPRA